MVFRVDVAADPGTNTGLTLVAEIVHDSPVRRSGYIDDKLFSIADNSVHVMDVTAPDIILATAGDLLRPVEWPEPIPLPLDEAALRRLSEQNGSCRPAGTVAGPCHDGDGGTGRPGLANGAASRRAAILLPGTRSHRPTDRRCVRIRRPQPPTDWQNPAEPADTNGDGEVAPNDAIVIINQLNRRGNVALPAYPALRQIDSEAAIDTTQHWDVNGDGFLSPIDALLVIDRLNRRSIVEIDLGSVDPNDPSGGSNKRSTVSSARSSDGSAIPTSMACSIPETSCRCSNWVSTKTGSRTTRIGVTEIGTGIGILRAAIWSWPSSWGITPPPPAGPTGHWIGGSGPCDALDA